MYGVDAGLGVVDLGVVEVDLFPAVEKVLAQISDRANITIEAGLFGNDEPIYAPIERTKNLADLMTYNEHLRRKYEKRPAKKEEPLYEQTTGKYGNKEMARDRSKLWVDKDGKTWTLFRVGDSVEQENHFIRRSFNLYKGDAAAQKALCAAIIRYIKDVSTAGQAAEKVLLEQVRMTFFIRPILEHKFGYNSRRWIKEKGNNIKFVGSGQFIERIDARIIRRKKQGRF